MQTDFCIVGSGIAGMSLALRLSSLGSVIMISKGELLSGSTPLAQGGIAAVTDFENDSFASHIEDTLKAGKYKNNIDAVKVLVESAPEVMKDLKNWGIEFYPDKHLEGGHSYSRIFHTSDKSGECIANGLAKQIDAEKNISFISNTVVYNLEAQSKTVRAYSFTKQENFSISSRAVIFATGGYSSLFASSTSPAGNIGSGIAVLKNAGANLKNMSSVQFHPTVLKKERFPRLLLTEAIRGAGAQIVDKDVKSIIDPLLPRDEVSKAIYNSEKKGREIFLDARMINNFSDKFGFIASELKTGFNLDPASDLLPITYGAHYCMGGVETDLFGQTNIKDIYAIGECAFTGVHGKNRLASNSLLEGLVFAKRVFEQISNSCLPEYSEQKPQRNISEFIMSDTLDPLFYEIQNILFETAGIEREKSKIISALKILKTKNPKATREQMMLSIAQEILEDAFTEFMIIDK